MIGYGWIFGTSLWVTFFGGVIAYRALPRQQFGALQHRVFPIYFFQSILIGSGLLVLWISSHPDVITHIQRPLVADVAQAYTLASVILAQSINYFVIGPMTSKTMFQRHKLEKEEGKAYNEPGVSEQMKALNRKFGSLHGISSLLNLYAVIALGFHGLWIGNSGVKGY
uniref:TMEM205-like domain-containing protein n=1 Tax=Moniliophthora roreri TaxID=221103 RepID=A0A0W0FAI0_MONRR